jgi:hypothetical protein
MTDKYVGTEGYKKGFTAGKYAIPDELDPNEMGPKYFLKWARYVWAQYITDRTLVPFGGFTPSGRSFYELRQYGIGQQDKRIYMDLVDPCEDKNKDEGYLNINWDNVQIMSKFRDLVRGKMLTMDFDVVTTAIDETSIKSRIEQVNMMKLLVNPVMQQMIAETGVMPTGVKLPPGIETVEDVEMYNKMGGLRLSHELMIQDAIESTNYESDWSSLKNQVIEDIIDLNVAATVTYVEKATGIVKVDRIEPEYLVCRASKYQDHRDIDFAGHIKRKTIQQIRIESDLSEEALYAIAKLYKGRGGNGMEIGGGPVEMGYQRTYRSDTGDSTGYAAYDNFSVDILEFFFIAKEAEAYIIGCHKDGNAIFDRVDLQAELDKRDIDRGKKIEEKVVEYVYRCRWIIGTEYVFDYGKEYAVVRQGHNGVRRAKLPIQIYSDRSPSLVERCVPFIDDIQLAVLKKRNVLAKMAPGPRMAIDKSLMEDSTVIGNKTYSILDLIELYPKTGVLVYESVGEWESSEQAGSNRPPITFMPAGVQEDIAILLQDVQFNMNLIRDVTGINEVSDGSSQQQDMLVKVMEGLTAATNNALRPHFQLYYGLYQNQCKYVAQKWQVAVLAGEINTGYIPIGDNILKPVLVSKDLYDYDFGIKITLRPTQEDRQMLLQTLFQMQQGNQVSAADYFVLYNMITSGDLKKAQLYMAKANAAYLKQLQQMELQKLQQQSQGNAQAAQMAEQAKAQTAQLTTQLEIQRMQVEYQLMMQRDEMLHQFKMQELTMQNAAKMEQAATEKTIDFALQKEEEAI